MDALMTPMLDTKLDTPRAEQHFFVVCRPVTCKHTQERVW